MHESNSSVREREPREPFRLGVNVCLIASALVLLLTGPYLVAAIRANKYSAEWLLVGPVVFLIIFLTFLLIEFYSRTHFVVSVFDYIRAFFGILIIVLSFPSSLREYRVRKVPDPTNIELLEQLSSNKDARIRALAILASTRHNFDDPALGALIHNGLLDKDPLVQQAAKLVIEDNFGIRLKNGVEGILQAQSFIRDVAPHASLMTKGLP